MHEVPVEGFPVWALPLLGVVLIIGVIIIVVVRMSRGVAKPQGPLVPGSDAYDPEQAAAEKRRQSETTEHGDRPGAPDDGRPGSASR